MTLWILVPFLALVAIVQTTLLPLVAIFGFKIDLALLVVVAWGLLSAPGEAAIWGFIVGIFLDLASGMPFGTQTLALTVIGLLLGLVQTTIFRSNVVMPPAATVVSTLAYNILLLGMLALLRGQIQWDAYLLRVTLPTALFNTLALPLIYFPLQWLHRRLRPQVEW